MGYKMVTELLELPEYEYGPELEKERYLHYFEHSTELTLMTTYIRNAPGTLHHRKPTQEQIEWICDNWRKGVGILWMSREFKCDTHKIIKILKLYY